MKSPYKLMQRRDHWKVLLPTTEGEHSVLDKKEVKFSTSTHRSEGLLDCVHVSVWGPSATVSLGGQRYSVSFIDNLSRHYWIYPMRQRFEALGMLVSGRI